MTKNDLSSRHFQRKISEFCELRIAPIASMRVLENNQPYMVALIIYRKSPLHPSFARLSVVPCENRKAELCAQIRFLIASLESGR